MVSVTNTSGAAVTYTILVRRLRLPEHRPVQADPGTGQCPPPPGPSDAQCGYVDVYDAPGTGNGTLATATPLSFGVPLAAALCYADDVDMYAFDGLSGQMRDPGSAHPAARTTP